MSRKELQHITLNKSKNQTKPSFKQEGFAAGISPYLRGSYATMYIKKPWKITPFNNPTSTKKNTETAQNELPLTFNLTNLCGYDSDYKHAQSDVDKDLSTVQSVNEMKMLFNFIPLDKITVSITINDNILPILALYIVAAEELGISLEQLSGTILNEVMVKPTYPDILSKKIITDIFKFTGSKMPKFNSISISSTQLQRAGIAEELELAYTLAKGLEQIKKAIESGINIDSFAPRISFNFATGMNHFTEIAKLRAARILWAKIIQQFNPKNPKSEALKIHCQTSNLSLTTENTFNNITRTTVEAMSAAFGGTQSLDTNALENGFDLPANCTERIARNTQLYLQQETHITKTVDPWAGSYHLEKITEDLITNSWKFITEIEKAGGVTKAIEKGIHKMCTTNKKVTSPKITETKNTLVYNAQIKKINELKATRNNLKVKKSLEALSKATKSGQENLLELAVQAAKNSATLNEISKALETTF